MSIASWQRMAVACLLAAIPGSIYAVDGVILIDQVHALAGNITPGDTPGFPVTITQPGSYKLSGNLTVADANTTAIRIAADYVTLDLNGFSIIGPVTCTSSPAVCPPAGTGVGVDAHQPEGTPSPRSFRVVNGTVRGMGNLGIFITGLGSSVENVRADTNAGGGILAAGTVNNSAATLNGSFGIFAITVRGSYMSDNHDVGLQLDGSGGVASDNIASFNGSHGISAPNGTVTNNTTVRNVQFEISALCPSVVVNNTVVSNTAGSITTSRDGCVLVNNATRP